MPASLSARRRVLDRSKNFLQQWSDVKRLIVLAQKSFLDGENFRDATRSAEFVGSCGWQRWLRTTCGRGVEGGPIVTSARRGAPNPWALSLQCNRQSQAFPLARRDGPCGLHRLNLEHFAFGEGLGAELCPGGPQPDVLNYAWRDYGNRVGVWRLIDLFDELALPVSVLANSSIYHYCPEVMDAFRARAATRWSATAVPTPSGRACLPEAEERQLDRGGHRNHRARGRAAAAGWLGAVDFAVRGHAGSTGRSGLPAIVLDWCMDDQPVWFSTRNGGRILSVPYPQELNDIPSIVGRKDSASSSRP